MRSVHSLLDECGESRRNPTNKTIHRICVPLLRSTPSPTARLMSFLYRRPGLNYY